MTQKEVEIQVEKTETDTIHICDGCGMEIDDAVAIETEALEGSLMDYVEPLHFCSKSCVDSVRATERRESDTSTNGMVSLGRGLGRITSALKFLWSPYGHWRPVGAVAIPFGFMPMFGLFITGHLLHRFPEDMHWRALLLSVLVHVVYAWVLLS